MNFEPQKFFVGLIDLFSVWLPGALLVYLVKDDVALLLLGRELAIAGTEGWIVFLFASYLAGQFAFLLGSFLDLLYDRLRGGTVDCQLERLAAGGRLSWPLTRWLAARLFRKDDKALGQALRIKKDYLDSAGAFAAINAFQWCKARLALDHPQALADVQRFEADSKFFRSLCAILLILFAWTLVKLAGATLDPGGALGARAPANFAGSAAGGAALFALAFWRYVERRAKAISQAYWFVLTAEHKNKAGEAATREPPVAGLTHAGGIVLRRDGTEPEYLRVETKSEPGRWVLPKGHIEPGEKPEVAAVREVLEESGVWARVHEKLDDVDFETGAGRVGLRLFLMEWLRTEAEEKPAPHPWLPPPATSGERRRIEWKRLDQSADLPAESHAALAQAAERVAARWK